MLELADDSPGGVVDHDLAIIRAGIAAREGRVADALSLYRSALAGYREAGCRLDVALVVLDMAALFAPGGPAVAAASPEGRAILESLGAEPLLARLSTAEESAAASDELPLTSLHQNRPGAGQV